ncbi:MAG: TrkA family potassium uptake protein [Blautia sp.]|nr:TrkA family potassium uptake protein [Blautia sp.]
MFHKNKMEKTTYAIIGLGRFGGALALALAENGGELLVIDRDEEKVRDIREYTENAYVVHSLDKKTLAETGIQNCDVAIVCIGEHLDTSILTTLNLVGMGIPKVIAKANSVEHGEILEKLGAEVVYPEKDMALRLARRLDTANVLDFIQLSEKINISKLHIPDCMVGKTVLDVDFRSKFGMNIIVIENRGTVMEMIHPDYVFRKDDILLLSGSKEGMQRLNEWIENMTERRKSMR